MNNNWIPVEKELPKASASTTLLVTMINTLAISCQKPKVFAARFTGASRWKYCDKDEFYPKYWKVVAWMPFPESYNLNN